MGRRPYEPKLGLPLVRGAQDAVKPTMSHETMGRREDILDRTTILPLEPVSLPWGYRVSKRLMDIIGAAVLLILLSPILLIVALVVKFQDGGPIIYRSERIGFCGKTIVFLKFRTMVVDAEKLMPELAALNEKDGPIFKIRKDPRVTPFGRFLRRFSIDELPQLYSVLTGEMSLVGPRPQLPHEVAAYSEEDRTRLRVKPGITCFWQVMGRSELTFQQWMELDRRYVREMSFLLDLKLLMQTFWVVIRSHGSY